MQHRRFRNFDDFIAGHDDMCEQAIEFLAEFYQDIDMIPKSVVLAYLRGCIMTKRDEE